MCGFAVPYVNEIKPIDIAVKWINYPMSGNTTADEPLGVAIRNLGTLEVANFDITYVFTNLQTLYTETNTESYGTYMSPIQPGQEITYPFMIADLNMSLPGTYSVKAWVSNCVGDTKQNNDSTGKFIYNVACGVITCYPNAIDEPELCSLDQDGGCNSAVPQYI
jgi:hypothetical protein